MKSKFVNVSINSAFVYQVQPIDPSYPCFIIYIQASANGKATVREVGTLTEIQKSLHGAGIQIIGFAFDGDNAYNLLHEQYRAVWKKPLYDN